jgi:hypothetical protein
VEALIIAPDRLRALLVAEADMGERIMRALILRRVGLLETGTGGPIIVGRADNGDVLRLESFLRRNGHPHQLLNPETDAEAKALIERFHVDPGQLPIVSASSGRSIRIASTTLRWWEPGRLASPLQFMQRPKGSRFWYSTAAPLAVRPAPQPESKTISAFRPGSPALL